MTKLIKVNFVVLLAIQFVVLIELQQKDYDICLKLISGVSFSKAPNDDIAKDYFDCGTKLCASYDKDYIFKICDAAHHEICDSGNNSHHMLALPNQTCVSGCSCSEYHCFDISLRRCVTTLDRYSTGTSKTRSSGSIILPKSPSSIPLLLQPPYSSLDSRQLNRLSQAVGTNSMPQRLNPRTQQSQQNLWRRPPPNAWKELTLNKKQESRQRDRTQSISSIKPKLFYVSLPQNHRQRLQFPGGYKWSLFPGFPDINSLFPGSGSSGSSGDSGVKWTIITNQPIDDDKKFPYFPGFPDINTLFPSSGGSGGSGWVQISPQDGGNGERFPEFPKPGSDEFPPAPTDWEPKPDESVDQPDESVDQPYESVVQPESPFPPAPAATWPSGSSGSASNEDSEKLFSGIPEKLINFDDPVPYVDLTEFLDDNE